MLKISWPAAPLITKNYYEIQKGSTTLQRWTTSSGALHVKAAQAWWNHSTASNPENKPVKRALHAALLSSETAWPAFGRADFFFFLLFPSPLLKPTWVSEWVRLWFGCFYLPEWECGVQGAVLKGGDGEGVDVGQNRGQYSKRRPRNRRRVLGSGATGSQWTTWKTGN